MTTNVETAIKSPECRQFRRTIWLSVTRINAHVHRNIVTRQDTFVVAPEGNRQESLEFPIYNVNHDSAIISKLQNNNHKSGGKILKAANSHNFALYKLCRWMLGLSCQTLAKCSKWRCRVLWVSTGGPDCNIQEDKRHPRDYYTDRIRVTF